MQGVTDDLLARVLADTADLGLDRYDGQRVVVPFASDWALVPTTRADDENIYYALGTYSVAVTGVLVIEPDAAGQPLARVEHRVHIFDRYNWDEGKSVRILGVPVSDEQLGRLHEAGLAQEYDVMGSSDTMTTDGYLDELLVTPPPAGQSADGRDGTRLDRDRERGDGRRTDSGRDQ